MPMRAREIANGARAAGVRPLRSISRRRIHCGARDQSRLVIVEPNGEGHRFWYCKLLAEQHLAQTPGMVVLLTTSVAIRRPEYALHLRDLVAGTSRIRIRLVTPAPSNSALSRLRLLAALVKCRHAVVIVPDADRMLLALLLTRPLVGRISLLFMRPPGTDLRQRVKAALVRLASRVHTVSLLSDPLGLEGWGGTRTPRATLVRDPVSVLSTAAPARQANKPIVLIGGRISRRKCVSEMIDAAHEAGWHLRIVGSLDDSCRTLAHQHAATHGDDCLSFRDDHVTDSELDAEIGRADLVSVVLDSQTGSSGILGRALAIGVPVIAGGNATVTNAVKQAGVGVIAKTLDPQDLAKALTEARTRAAELSAAVDAVGAQLGRPSEFYNALAVG